MTAATGADPVAYLGHDPEAVIKRATDALRERVIELPNESFYVEIADNADMSAAALAAEIALGSEGGKQRDPLASGKPHPISPSGTGSNDAQDARDERAASVTARRDGQSAAERPA